LKTTKIILENLALTSFFNNDRICKNVKAMIRDSTCYLIIAGWFNSLQQRKDGWCESL
jgi:hypothetical protein